MQFTAHGAERVLRRTNLLGKDVLSIISSNAVVSLGFWHNYEYLLFYSPNDGVTKIAVVTRDRGTLVSVWYDDYVLPKGVSRVTRQLKRKARQVLAQFAIKKVESKETRDVKLDIVVGKKIVYSHDFGRFLAKDLKSIESIIQTLLPNLSPIIKVVEDCQSQIPGSVKYDFWLFEPESARAPARFAIRHKKLRTRVPAALA